jgi:hypothetical protein
VERVGRHLTDRQALEFFKTAIADLLQSTPPVAANAQRLYELLYLVKQFTPRPALAIIWKFLRQETLLHVIYDETFPLHNMALGTLEDYAIDAAAIDYIEETCPSAPDFGTLLTGFELLTQQKDADRAFRFLRHLIPRMARDNQYSELTAHLLSGLMGPLPWVGLFHFLEWSDRKLKPSCEEGYTRFCQSLREILIPWNAPAASYARSDYEWFCAAWLHAGYFRFTAKDLLDLAGIGVASGLAEPCSKVIRRIYDLSVASKLHLPWCLEGDFGALAWLKVSDWIPEGLHLFDPNLLHEEAVIIAGAMSLQSAAYGTASAPSPSLAPPNERLNNYVYHGVAN